MGNQAVGRALHDPAAAHGLARSPAAGQAARGAPLAPELRTFFGARFGQDLGDVRVHRGPQAERAAEAAGAAAYTVGRDVVFGRGSYAPDTLAGRRLIAHELAHAVQQRPGGEGQGAAETPALEAAAERASRAALPGAGTVAVQGRAPAGMARTPRSLSGSMDVEHATLWEVETEIREIENALRFSGVSVSAADVRHLNEELARLKDRRDQLYGGLGGWSDFAPAFNREFAEILHVFDTTPAAAGTTHAKSPTGPALTPGDLHGLFTPAQRDKIKDFIATRQIPERLFDGTDLGHTTAQQRLLISAHILANGTYRPGSFEQRVHAHMCWHWVQIVHHYAGATPGSGDIAQGVMGSFDPLGGAVLGTGKPVSIWHGERVRVPDLPAQEEADNVGPLPEGSKQAEAARAEAEANPTAPSNYHRQKEFPFERFNELRAGDWVWYYNANASGGGGHSVIFSHWGVDPVTLPDGTRYRMAWVYSQPNPDRGGRWHSALLGDRYAENPDPKRRWEPIVPVTHVTRVGADAAPAATAADIAPGPGGKAATLIANQNEAFIKAKEKALKGTMDRAKLRQWLRDRNLDFMMAAAHHLTADQVRLVREANQSDDLEALVRLNQRMRALANNVKLLDAGTAKQNEGVDKRYAEAKTKADAARGKAVAEISTIDAELATLKTETAARQQQRAGLDVDPQIKRLLEDWNRLGTRISAAKTSAERDTLRAERKKKQDEIAAARALKAAQAAPLRALDRELRTLTGRATALEAKRAAQVKARDAADDKLPYGLVHPGTSGKEKAGTTGKLADLTPAPDWKTLITPAPPPPAAPAAPAKKKP
ncbi:MAG TPA: DUF4157 domain-containing protein [Longimicrobium sp.]|nr:DUF4157 domain-containing protein [Longimicrobium sp.]